MKHLTLLLPLFFLGCNSSSDVSMDLSALESQKTATPAASSSPAEETKTEKAKDKKPTPSPSPSPDLRQEIACTDSLSFQQNADMRFDYAISYKISTYSDGTSKVACGFTSILVTVVSSPFSCTVPLADDKLGSKKQTDQGPCGVSYLPLGFFNSLKCSPDSLYAYSFNTQAFSPLNWPTRSYDYPVLPKNCAATTF